MSPDLDDRQRLAAGATTLGLSLDDATLDRLIAYRDLLVRWNKVYNLTAVRDPEQMITQHLLDSLAAVGPLRRHCAGQDRKSTRLNSSHRYISRMPSSA
jgi:16S rRNA (guanine527-N7)-methyltransferase